MGITVRDIAQAAGVSVGTASRALTGNGYTAAETKKLVLETAERLGYIPVKHSKSKGVSNAIGVVLPDVSFPFYAAFLKYVEVELNNLGYSTMVWNTLGIQGRVCQALERAELGELRGLIVNADLGKDEVARLANLPTVSFERLISPKIPVVSSDHYQGGRMAGELLRDAGCRNVLIMTTRHSNRLIADYRVDECRKVLEKAGAKVTIAEFNSVVLSYHYIREVVAQYVGLYPRLDGIFSDDVTACCCVSELLRRGKKLPEDVKVLGYDGMELVQLSVPPVTTIVQDVPSIAHACVDVLQKRLSGENTPGETLVPVKIRKGGTV